jgi:hypothetical protein
MLHVPGFKFKEWRPPPSAGRLQGAKIKFALLGWALPNRIDIPPLQGGRSSLASFIALPGQAHDGPLIRESACLPGD